MKNKVIFIALALILSLPVSVQAVDEVIQEPVAYEQQVPVETENLEEGVVPQTTLSDEDKDPESFPKPKPISKKQVAKKFLAAMFGVICSSLIIFFGLSIYNRIRENIKNQVKTPEGTTPLATPDDMESAVKTFLDKTRWG